MPRIRKKTSNRKGTNDRAKVKHKIVEGRKKAKKLAKKNPQWKSRVKKDPGIPNAFPYKDQIIAEVAQLRQTDAADKERRKEQQKTLKASDVATMSGLSVFGGNQRKLSFASKSKPKAAAKPEDEGSSMDEDEAPLLLDRSLPDLAAVIDKADVLIHVLDARDPQAHRNPGLEKLIMEKKKKLLLLLNKIDLVPRETVQAWLTSLRKDHPTIAFRSASPFLPVDPDAEPTKGKEKEATGYDTVGAEALSSCLALWAHKNADPLSVAFVGLPNSGKSSIINSLIQSPLLPVYKPSTNVTLPTTTPHPLGIADKLQANGHPIYLIDTPGITFTSPPPSAALTPEDRMKMSARDMILRNRGKMEKVSDPLVGANEIVSRANAEDLMIHYNVPAFVAGDLKAFLTGVARATGRLKKGGVPDLVDQARSILRDVRVGKLLYYAVPPQPPSPPSTHPISSEGAFLDLYKEFDPAILSTLRSRKDMILAEGAVRIKSGAQEARTVDLAARFEVPVKSHGSKEKASENLHNALADSDEDSDEELDDGDEDEDDHSENDDDADDGSDDEAGSEDEVSEDEVISPPRPTTQRKRKQAPSPDPPGKKKVAFNSRAQILSKASQSLASKVQLDKPLKSSIAVKKSSTTSITKASTMAKPKPKEIKVANAGKEVISGAAPRANGSAEEPYDFTKHFK